MKFHIDGSGVANMGIAHGVVRQWAEDAGFTHIHGMQLEVVDPRNDICRIDVGTLQERRQLNIGEADLYKFLAMLIMAGFVVSRLHDSVGDSVNLDSSILEHGTDAHPAKPFIYNRFGKVE